MSQIYDRCGCGICAAPKKTEGYTATCGQCYRKMQNVRVVCYRDPRGLVTEAGHPWTARHGWSVCDCGNLGGYIMEENS